MNTRRLLLAPFLGMLLVSPLYAQSGPAPAPEPESVVAPAVIPEVDAATLRGELVALRDVFEAQADALAHGILPSTLEWKSTIAARPAAAGGGGAVGSIGTLASTFGPLSNSVASLTFERDPELSNSTSETFAMIGLGSAVVGGVLNLIAGGGDDEVADASIPEEGLARAAEDFSANQSAAERPIDEFERLAEETATLVVRLEDDGLDTKRRGLVRALLRRGERAILRYDYLTRNAAWQLAELKSGLASGAQT
jgi:hypothetical protein